MSWSSQDPTSTSPDNVNPPATDDSSNPNAEAGPSTHRTLRACSSCSQQKLKCNGATPCRRCIDLGFPDKCIYLPSLRGRMRGKRRPPDTSNIAKLLNTNGGSQLGMISQGDSFGMLPPEKPTMDYVRWRRNTTLSESVPRNSTIWDKGKNIAAGEDKLTNVIGKRRRSGSTEKIIIGLETVKSSSKSMTEDGQDRQPNSDVADRLTSLPLPGDRNPLAVLAEASASVSAQDGQAIAINRNAQPDNRAPTPKDKDGYYMPLHRTLKDEAPHIMTFISVAEAEKLFKLYFTYLHPHLPLLDPLRSSPSAVARRNNFLFNSICCSSAKARDPILWSRLSEFSKFEMERIPKEKNIDVIQGHLIYTSWNLHPPKHFELDMTWLRLGLAVRTAIDINLHRVALSTQAREGLPWDVLRAIARSWLAVYITDSTMSAQLGKPSTMTEEHSVRSYIALLRQSHQNGSTASTLPPCADLWIAALAEWTQMLTRSIDAFRIQTELPEDVNTTDDSTEINDSTHTSTQKEVSIQHFRRWREDTELLIRESHQNTLTNSNSKGKTLSLTLPFTMANIRLYQQYGELVVHSLALERVSGSLRGDLPVTVIEMQSAATRLIHTYQSSFDALPDTRLGCPDILHTFVTYAAVSLLRLLQPQFNKFVPGTDEVLGIAQKAADMLGRAVEAKDGSSSGHSVFLTKLIEVKRAQFSIQHKPKDSPGNQIGSDNWQEVNHFGDQCQVNNDNSPPNLIQPMSLDLFGEILGQDQGNRSIWPPMFDTSPDNSASTYDAYLNSLFPTFGAEYNLDSTGL